MSNSIIFIGSVKSSEIVLKRLIENDLMPEKIFSLKDEYAGHVSGYRDLSLVAEAYGLDSVDFKNINEPENIQLIQDIRADYIFVIGLSQLISRDIINAAKKGVIGYHPTALPKFRGRAAIPWQILLDVKESKCSLFYIDEGTDTGDIIDQETYLIHEDDYAKDVEKSSDRALQNMMERVIPEIKNDTLTARAQDEDEATYLLKRVPEDGRIDWNHSVKDIYKLIRATSKPYPGASSYYKDKKMIFWRAEVLMNTKYYGIPGQIIQSDKDGIDIFCRDGILRVTDYEIEADTRFTEGDKFS